MVQEPRGTGDAFDAAMRDFYVGIDGGRGAVLFAVCRGKVRRQRSPCTMSAHVMLARLRLRIQHYHPTSGTIQLCTP